MTRLFGRGSRAGLVIAAIGLIATLAAMAPIVQEPVSSGGPPQLRKLTEAQYRNSIADIFGEDIKVDGRFPPDPASEGLIAIGSSTAGLSATGAEYYMNLAQFVARQVVAEDKRARLVSCTPKNAAAMDNACATAFVAKYGEALFRRPLSAQEVSARVAIAAKATKITGSFYDGLKYATISLLTAPDFIFRIESVETPAGRPALSGAARASRLSFLLWNGPPDDALRAAAAAGDLNRPDGLRAQVDRMMASSRFERGMRAFFEDMLGFSAYTTLAKDGLIYPTFSQAVLASTREQVLRTIIDHVVANDGDYRELFTTRKTFLNRSLGYFYRYPVAVEQGWEAITWPADQPRAGLLSQASFLALHSHPGRSSPTLRGLAVREIFMCQHVPPPPSNIDFSLAQDVHNTTLRTARARLTAHMTNPTCAGCHKLMDPIGFALENYDGAGQFRSEENDTAIDPSGDINGAHFANAAELGAAVGNDPATSKCLVNRLIGYGLGRVPVRGERQWVAYLSQGFAQDHRILPLLRRIATSESFYKIDGSAPSPSPEKGPVALQTIGQTIGSNQKRIGS